MEEVVEMTVKELLDILENCSDPEENIVCLVDEHTVFEPDSVEIAPETGNVFINFKNWYNELLKKKGYLHEPSVPPSSNYDCVSESVKEDNNES